MGEAHTEPAHFILHRGAMESGASFGISSHGFSPASCHSRIRCCVRVHKLLCIQANCVGVLTVELPRMLVHVSVADNVMVRAEGEPAGVTCHDCIMEWLWLLFSAHITHAFAHVRASCSSSSITKPIAPNRCWWRGRHSVADASFWDARLPRARWWVCSLDRWLPLTAGARGWSRGTRGPLIRARSPPPHGGCRHAQSREDGDLHEPVSHCLVLA
mmetsp:Transcript_18081/g.48647  ORF Transcript_18081/g.48647 Transcript_18081/m.48647 type:complete len:215 (-) Transcript_18081:682-1326(-)